MYSIWIELFASLGSERKCISRQLSSTQSYKLWIHPRWKSKVKKGYWGIVSKIALFLRTFEEHKIWKRQLQAPRKINSLFPCLMRVIDESWEDWIFFHNPYYGNSIWIFVENSMEIQFFTKVKKNMWVSGFPILPSFWTSKSRP
jgi:hypothetical protein